MFIESAFILIKLTYSHSLKIKCPVHTLLWKRPSMFVCMGPSQRRSFLMAEASLGLTALSFFLVS